MIQLEGKYGKDCKIFIDEVEESALATIQSILDDEVSANVPVRIMPDTHDGVDIVIGFTMPLSDRVNPNHIGVDIGCGVLCARIPKLSISLADIDEHIRAAVPMGFERRKSAVPINFCEDGINALISKIGLNAEDVWKQIGTLGGGNHFIEIGEDGDDWYLFIHSGSRNFGLQVCKYHAAKAKANGSKYLMGNDMYEYISDMYTAQLFADTNRAAIADSIRCALDILDKPFDVVCDTKHNYIDHSRNIIRKGAVSAEKGQLLVIPMNMRDGVLLCAGKGNADWNYSAPHGAGRVLSRAKAKQQLAMSEFEKEMHGIYSTSVCESTLDESPMAYKDMQTIIDCIVDTVEIKKIIKPILNIKAR